MEEIIKNEQNTVENGKEKCVICGAETEYIIDTPISERQDYIKSIGQLCPKCYYEAYLKKDE